MLLGNSLDEITDIKFVLDQHFGIKDLGVLKFFMGLEAAHSTDGIYLCQRQYCLDLLQDAGISSSKACFNPN